MNHEERKVDQFEQILATPRNSHAPTGSPRYWEAGEYASLLNQLECLLTTALETNQIPFDIRHQWGAQQALRNPVGVPGYRNLSSFLPACGELMDVYWPGYSYRPDFQLFFDCFQKHPFGQLAACAIPVWAYDKASAATAYNNFIGCLRTEAVRRGVRKSLADWRANVGDQAASIRRYLEALQTQYRFLRSMRIDLHYAECAADDSDAMERTSWAASPGGGWVHSGSTLPSGLIGPETRGRIDALAAMAHRDQFFNNKRGADKVLFDSMVGYVCKMEQGGSHRAIHFHCIFLFQAARLSQAAVDELKRRAEERWRTITRGHGLMYDCDQRPDRDELMARGLWALGRIDSTNPVQAARLTDYVVRYFAKNDDQMLSVKPNPKARTLTMGRLPSDASSKF